MDMPTTMNSINEVVTETSTADIQHNSRSGDEVSGA